MHSDAGIAQLVEHNLAKVGVASSSLVSRSNVLTASDVSEVFLFQDLAGWQSGYAAACKAVDAGSIPTSALNLIPVAIKRCPGGGTGRRKGLKIRGRKAYGFESRPGHQRAAKSWRRGSESNRRTRLCRPLHNHSATPPARNSSG